MDCCGGDAIRDPRISLKCRDMLARPSPSKRLISNLINSKLFMILLDFLHVLGQ